MSACQKATVLHIVLLSPGLLYIAVGLELRNVIRAAQKERQALMQLGGGDV